MWQQRAINYVEVFAVFADRRRPRLKEFAAERMNTVAGRMRRSAEEHSTNGVNFAET